MITSLYIVSKDGRPLYHYNFQETEEFNEGITDATLFSGIIAAIQGVMREIDAGQVSNFNTEKNKIFLKSDEEIAYVLIAPLSSDIDQEQIDTFFEKIQENLPLNLSTEDITLSKKENMVLNTVTKMLYEQWLKESQESKAAKKLKEDLW